MPTITVMETVHAPPDQVFSLLSDMTAFPRYMKNVESIAILDRGPGHTITRWKAHIQGGTFQWEERDEFDDERRRIEFAQTRGDLKVFRGFWQIVPHDEGSEVTLQTEFEFGVPMLAALLNPIGKMALRENSRAMLRAIAGTAAGPGDEPK